MRYGNASLGKTHVIHLDKDEDLLESMREYVKSKGIRNGVILTGFGTLDRCRFHAITTTGLPPHDEFVTVEGPLEVVGIDGIIANGEIHAHYEVANLDGSFGGHLEPGCRVLYLCEVVIAELDGIDMTFEVCPKTKLRLLSVKSGSEEVGPSVDLDEDGNVLGMGRAKGWELN